jgi:hypothetical protein
MEFDLEGVNMYFHEEGSETLSETIAYKVVMRGYYTITHSDTERGELRAQGRSASSQRRRGAG